MAQHIVTAANSPGAGFTDPAAQSLLVVTSGAVMTGTANMTGGFSVVDVAGQIQTINSLAIVLGTQVVGGADTGGNNVVTIESTGHVSGGASAAISANGGSTRVLNNGILDGLIISGSANQITNNGSMLFINATSDDGVSGGMITNTGSMGNIGGSVAVISNYMIVNTGTMSGGPGTSGTVRIDGAGNRLDNSGTIAGAVTLFNVSGSNSIVNFGDISASIGSLNGIAISAGAGDETVDNQGHINGRVILNGGTNQLFNTGIITGDYFGGSGADSISNAGRIDGPLTLGDGANILRNSGVVTGTCFGGVDADTFNNNGTIRGSVVAGDGADTVNNRLGIILGTIDLGAGDDTGIGGDSADTFIGGQGVDTLSGNGGNDRFFAGILDGSDTIDGGDGIDTYDSSQVNVSTLIDLVEGTATGIAPGLDLDFLDSIENAIGSDGGDDTIIGTDGVNILSGLSGKDTLIGAGGNDTLKGGIGADNLNGGAGREYLYGGGLDNAADIFDFNAITESGTASGTRDWILDFEDGFDKIDLSTIDSSTKVAGNGAFKIIAGAFTTAGGEVKITTTASGNTFIQINNDTDTAADMTIMVKGTPTLTAADFIL